MANVTETGAPSQIDDQDLRAAEQLAETYEKELHAINSQLVIGIYPSPGDWVRKEIARGFVTSTMPLIVFGTESYGGGGLGKIPLDPEKNYLISGINALYLAGFTLAAYGSSRLGTNLSEAAELYRGYWIFKLPMLWKDGGETDPS